MAEKVIDLREVSIYQKNYLVLNHVNLTIEKGEFAYLVGKTGSGKSSLLKVLYGDLNLQEGQGTVVGQDLRKLNTSKIPALRRHLGIVFQDFQLLTDRNVEKNLYFVLKATGWKDKNAMRERIHETLEDVGMATKKHKMPFQLSGGEQQRVSIARALLNHPELILADEPTGNLDPETSVEIMNLIRKVSLEQGCAVFMATHDYSLIKRFPADCYKCAEGQIKKTEIDELFVV